MKNLQIEIPSGYEIDEDKSTFTNIVFKEIPEISAKQRMLDIWRSCNNVRYSPDNCRTYLKDKEPMFQQDWNNKKLYYRYSLIYQIFEKEYNINEVEINNLVISTLSKDLNCKNLEGEGGSWLDGLVWDVNN